MKTCQSRRQTAKVSHSRWVAYATASAATALAGSHSAEAAIHYSGRLDVRFPPRQFTIRTFGLDSGGVFLLKHRGSYFGSGVASFVMNGISVGFRGYYYHKQSFVSELSFGQKISAGVFYGRNDYGGYMVNQFGGGQWTDPGVGFIGFRFNSGAGIQYGWARVKMGGITKNNGFKLIDYAYADPGEAIRAGDGIPAGEDGQDMSEAPDQGSLGGLALGAVGLLAWRKSRSRTARYTKPPLPV